MTGDRDRDRERAILDLLTQRGRVVDLGTARGPVRIRGAEHAAP